MRPGHLISTRDNIWFLLFDLWYWFWWNLIPMYKKKLWHLHIYFGFHKMYAVVQTWIIYNVSGIFPRVCYTFMSSRSQLEHHHHIPHSKQHADPWSIQLAKVKEGYGLGKETREANHFRQYISLSQKGFRAFLLSSRAWGGALNYSSKEECVKHNVYV